MDLRKLTYFITVIDEGSISAAAERLHMTQPPLSQAVLALEDQLGAKLLERHARGVRPTVAGLLLAEQGRNLLRWSERISTEVGRLGAGESGQLLVASVPTFAWSHLPSLLQVFGAAAPGVEVQLADPDPAGVLQMAAEGAADIGFVSTSDPDALATANPDLIVEPLVELPLSLAVGKSLLRDAENSNEPRDVNVRDYKDVTWFLPNEVPGFPGLEETMRDLWRNAGFYPSSIQHVSTLHTSIPLIVAGMGVTLLPGPITNAAFSGVTNCHIDIPVDPLLGTTVRTKHVRPSAALERFLEIMAGHTWR